jgi:hypothetical protein
MSFSQSYGDSSQQYNNQGTSSTSSDFTKTPVNQAQITGALNQATGLYDKGNPTINAGFNGLNSGAASASGLYGAADPSLTNTLNGSYLSSGNPQFQGDASAEPRRAEADGRRQL